MKQLTIDQAYIMCRMCCIWRWDPIDYVNIQLYQKYNIGSYNQFLFSLSKFSEKDIDTRQLLANPDRVRKRFHLRTGTEPASKELMMSCLSKDERRIIFRTPLYEAIPMAGEKAILLKYEVLSGGKTELGLTPEYIKMNRAFQQKYPKDIPNGYPTFLMFTEIPE